VDHLPLETSRRSYVQVFPLEQRGRRGWQRQVVSFDPPGGDGVDDRAPEPAVLRSPCQRVTVSPCQALEGWPRARDELGMLRQHLIGLLDSWFDISRRRTLLVLALPESGWSSRHRISQALQSAIASSRLPITVTDLTEARPAPAPTARETIIRLSTGFEQCIVLADSAGAATHAASMTQLAMRSGLVIFGPRPDAVSAALPPSVPIYSVLGADEVGPLIAAETPLSRLLLDLCRTHPSLPNRLQQDAFPLAAIYQPLPRGPWLEQAGDDLLVTSWGAAPVVRYRLGWQGRIISYPHLCDVLSRERALPLRQIKRLTRVESPCWKLPLIVMASR
jgi:hypothetical protein